MKIKHSNGEIYTGDLINEDAHRVWIRTAKGQIFQIMKADILSKS